MFFFFFQAEDGIRDKLVTGVQTCALPIYTRAGKNLVGAFHQPAAVLIDTETLRTLPPRELTAGWCEAIKQGAVGDRKLFERTRKFLEDEARRNADGGRGKAEEGRRKKTRSPR